jgi:enterobacterial common antigen flippase
VKDKFWIYLSSSVTAGIVLFCGLLSGTLSARLLGPEGRGELALLTYFPAIIGSIFSLALPQAVSFMISRGKQIYHPMQTAGIHLAALLGLLGALGIAPCAYVMLSGHSSALRLTAVLLCLSGPAMVLNPTLYAIYRSLHNFNWVNCGQIIVAGVYPIVLFALVFTAGMTPVTAGVSFVGVQLLLTILHLRRIGTDAWMTWAGSDCYMSLLRYAFRFFLPTAATLAYINADKALLLKLTSLEQIGYYSVAAAIAFPISTAAEVFSQVTFIEVSQSPRNGAGRLLSKRFQVTQFVVVLMVAALIPILKPILHYVFGPTFDAALGTCLLLVISMLFRGLGRLLDNGLRATDVVWPGTLSSIVSGAILVFLGWRWTPGSGAEGFAAATLVADIFGMGTLLFASAWPPNRHLGEYWGLRPSVARLLYDSVTSRIFRRAYSIGPGQP